MDYFKKEQFVVFIEPVRGSLLGSDNEEVSNYLGKYRSHCAGTFNQTIKVYREDLMEASVVIWEYVPSFRQLLRAKKGKSIHVIWSC